MTSWRSIVLAACLAGSVARDRRPETLVTVAQRDRFRSARAPRTADVSADGRSVAFESLARLVPADTDDRRDIYVLDRATGRVTLESGARRRLRIRARADQRRRPLRRLRGARPPTQTRAAHRHRPARPARPAATRVLTGTGPSDSIVGWSRSPDISDDGRVVAFSSASTTLTGGPDANGGQEDVYIVRLPGGHHQPRQRRLSRRSTRVAGTASCRASAPTDDGWRLPRRRRSTRLPRRRAGREKSVRQVYLRDAIGGRTTRVTRALQTRPAEWRQLDPRHQRRRATRGLRLGGVEPPRR